MNQTIEEEHLHDEVGNPTGGTTTGLGLEIRWQDGPIPNGEEANGAFVEGVIAAAVGRMRHYQESRFSCRENALCITKLEEALMWLNARTKERIARGVEGKHEE